MCQRGIFSLCREEYVFAKQWDSNTGSEEPWGRRCLRHFVIEYPHEEAGEKITWICCDRVSTCRGGEDTDQLWMENTLISNMGSVIQRAEKIICFFL